MSLKLEDAIALISTKISEDHELFQTILSELLIGDPRNAAELIELLARIAKGINFGWALAEKHTPQDQWSAFCKAIARTP